MNDIAIGNWPEGELAQQWQDVLSSDLDVHRRALAFWAHNRDKLPGPIEFTLRSGIRQHAALLRPIQESKAQCECGKRLVLMPTNCTVFYRPFAQEDCHTLTAVTPPLTLGLWSGDVRPSSVRLAIKGKSLTQDASRTPGLPRRGLVESGAAVSYVQSIRLEEIAAGIEKMDGAPYPVPAFIRTARVGARGYTAIDYYPFAVTHVDLASTTVEIAVNRNTKVIDYAKRGSRHKCG